MARALVLCALLCLTASASGVSPVQKVIELLEENKGKIATDLAAEEKEMEEYATFCDDELTAKGYAIKDATKAIAALEAAITEGEAEISDGEAEVAKLGTEMAAKEKELGEATAVRTAAHAAFVKTESELVGSIDSLERAVMEVKKDSSFLQMKKGAARRPSTSRQAVKKALMAVSSIIDASAVNVERRRALQGLLQDAQASAEGDGDELRLRGVDAPKADAYSSISGGFLEKLSEMQEKAESQLSEARSGEMNEGHSYDMMAQSLTDSIKVGKEKTAAAKSNIEENTEAAGKAKDELVETTKAKKADEAYVSSLTAECNEAKASWDERQASAKEEMAVIDKAKDILASRVKAFVQVKAVKVAVVAHDVYGDSPKEAAARSSVVSKLQGLSKTFKSYALMEMVSAAAADPFEKIKGLIEEMITKLQNEANEEATQKAFCDEEISKSKTSKEEKTMTSDKLKARLDKATATKAELEQSVKELEAEVAALDKGDAEATKLRQEESAANAKASKDFKEAAEAVTEAISVLREYYEGAALVQTKAAAPSFGGAKSDSANVIISILEMSGEDFEKLYMETTQEEAEAAAAYKKLMDENKVAKAAKLAEVKGSESEIKSLDVAMKNNEEDLTTVNTELDAVLAYMDKLKPQCESKAMSYEEKKSRRDAEIEGLKEALSILSAA